MSPLMLLAACLVSFAAQTTPVVSSSTTMPPVMPSQQMNTLSPTNSTSGLVMLQVAVRSGVELNQTTVAPVLGKLHEIIQAQRPGLNFTLSVRNITRV